MSMMSEFKEFAMKGSVMDLAVGVIIGGAFGKIVDSLVGDVIMPIVSKIFGGLDFSNYFVPLAGQTATTLVEAKKAGAGSGLWQFHHDRAQLHHPGLHHLHHDQANEPPEKNVPGASGSAAGRCAAVARNPRQPAPLSGLSAAGAAFRARGGRHGTAGSGYVKHG